MQAYQGLKQACQWWFLSHFYVPMLKKQNFWWLRNSSDFCITLNFYHGAWNLYPCYQIIKWSFYLILEFVRSSLALPSFLSLSFLYKILLTKLNQLFSFWVTNSGRQNSSQKWESSFLTAQQLPWSVLVACWPFQFHGDKCAGRCRHGACLGLQERKTKLGNFPQSLPFDLEVGIPILLNCLSQRRCSGNWY